MKVEDLAGGVVLGGRFRLTRMLGSGSFGVVWAAAVLGESDLPREVAIKVYSQPYQSSGTGFLLHEREVARSLDHERLVRVYGAGRLDGLFVMWMEYVGGETLLSRVGTSESPKGISTDEALGWLGEIAEGLAYLHAMEPPIVHGDLKLDNVLLDPGLGARLADFGQSREMPERFIATDGTGALPYLAPEILGRGTDGEGQRCVPSDVYAFGAIAYRFLTGRFPRRTYPEVMNLTPYPRPIELNKSIPESLDALVLRCLEKRSEARYQTGSEVLAVLNGIRDELTRGDVEAVALPSAGEPILTVADELAELGQDLMNNERAVEAVAELEAGMERVSTSPRLLLVYAAAARATSRREAARLAYERAIRWMERHDASDDDLRGAKEGCATLDVELKRFEEAVDGFAWLVERWPDKRRYRFQHGVALGLAADYQKALDVFQELQADGPPNALICAKIGFVHIQLGDFELATQYFNEALMLDAYDPTALFQMARMRAIQGRKDKAFVYLERLESVQGAQEQAEELARLLGRPKASHATRV